MKGEFSPSVTFISDNTRTAEFLMNSDNHGLLREFWGHENTVAAVARTLGIKPNALLYQVKAMLKLGLLEVSSRRARAGRSITAYRLVADQFYIPFEVTRFENKSAFIRANLEPLFRTQIETEGRETEADRARGGWGLFMRMNEQRNILTEPRLRAQLESAPPEPPRALRFLRSWGLASLSSARAERLLGQLHEIVKELESIAEDGPEATRYLIQITMLPLPND